MRAAVQRLEGGMLMATTWLDNKFLNMYSTCYVEGPNGSHTVLRWNRAAGERMSIPAPLCLQEYQLNMGAVDRLDKSNAMANIRMRRCQKRYHRVIFFWLLSSFGHHNTKILVEKLVGGDRIKALKRESEVREMGYFHWFQYTLGKSLIEYGISIALWDASVSTATDSFTAATTPAAVAATAATPVTGAAAAVTTPVVATTPTVTPTKSVSPTHFLPSHVRKANTNQSIAEALVSAAAGAPMVSPGTTPSRTLPITVHQYVSIKKCNGVSRNYCRLCKEDSVHVGKGKYLMSSSNKPCPRPYHCCQQCKVVLCEDCMHNKYDHKTNPLGSIVRQKIVRVVPPGAILALPMPNLAAVREQE